jgi:hypothetical protein
MSIFVNRETGIGRDASLAGLKSDDASKAVRAQPAIYTVWDMPAGPAPGVPADEAPSQDRRLVAGFVDGFVTQGRWPNGFDGLRFLVAGGEASREEERGKINEWITTTVNSLGQSWRADDKTGPVKTAVDRLMTALQGEDPVLGRLSGFARNVLMQRAEAMNFYLSTQAMAHGVADPADPQAISRRMARELAVRAAQYMRGYHGNANNPQELQALKDAGLAAWTAVRIADGNKVALSDLVNGLEGSDAIKFYRALALNRDVNRDALLVSNSRAAEALREIEDAPAR